ncbi:hypothetical protein KVR01_009578 [Diaporthe batatas]|uniref:uncharacterized protein n=1 Tax=Diaporthe batatas TaxID=748121 RepID=UPI001D03EA6D|nr:uncharacterized protein KVR01_009578 [Diaporthe batatas]KAG8161314.1 hypothetical protein KVR01_009578 [Diaporthe batatas]
MVTTRVAMQLAAGVMGSFTVAQNCMIIPISTAPKSFPVKPEAWELRPDWTSLRLCGCTPKHCSVMCFMYQRDAAEPFGACPRTLLCRTVGEVEERLSTRLLVGFEAEFVLLDDTLNPPSQPLDPVTGDSTMSGLRGTNLDLLEEIVEAVEMAGINVYNYHTEGVGHFEIALSPLSPVASVDALMCLHETIRALALRRGLKATLAPRPTLDAAQNGSQNGCHVHISLNPPRRPESFLAGVLQKVPQLCALGLASFDSYARIVKDGAGLWVGWGTENRDLAVRGIEPNHWELRFADATANLYIFLAVALAAGGGGVDRQLDLAFKDLRRFPASLNPEDLRGFGISRRMPSCLQESLDALSRDDDVKQWMGPIHSRRCYCKPGRKAFFIARMT